MPEVKVTLTEEEIKEIIMKTKKSVAEGIKELILKNRDNLSLTEEQLRELITQVVFSHTEHLISQIREIVGKGAKEVLQRPQEIKKLREELEKLKEEIDSLKNSLKKELSDLDVNLRVFTAKKRQESERVIAAQLKELKREVEEAKKKASSSAYWTVELMFTTGNLKQQVERLERDVQPFLQRIKRECSVAHKSEVIKGTPSKQP